MAPESTAAAAAATAGSGSDASDGEADAARFYSRRRSCSRSSSPSPIPTRSRSRSRSRSNTPPLDLRLRLSAAAVTSAPTSAAADVAAASDPGADAGAGGRAPSPRRRDGKGPPRGHLDSDANAGTGRRGERCPSLPSDSDNSVASASEDDGGGVAVASSRAGPSSHMKASIIKPIRSRPMDVSGHHAAASSELRTRRRHSPGGRGTPEYQKRPPRVWSPEDEVAILSALIEYRAKKGRLPASIQDTSKLHLQLDGRLTANASTTQLSDKVRRLKHKYKLLVTRANNGQDLDLPTQHERDVYELSKKVWALKSLERRSLAHEDTGDAESNEEQEIKESDEDMANWREHRERASKKPKTFRFENSNGNATVTVGRATHGNGSWRDDTEKGKQMYPHLWAAVEELSKEHLSGPIFRKAFGVLEKSKARAMEEKLRKLRMSVIRQQLRRMDLTKESVGMVLDALEGTS